MSATFQDLRHLLLSHHRLLHIVKGASFGEDVRGAGMDPRFRGGGGIAGEAE